MGLLNEVTQVISRQLNVNIRKLAIETNDGIFEGKGIRQYRKEDVETIGLIYHLGKEKGLTLPGAP